MSQQQATKSLTVNNGMVVSLDYTLSLEDGSVVDTTDGQEPLEYLQGQGHIISGLEEALYGMSVGEEKKVVVTPADAYGDIDPDEFQLVPRNVFPKDMDLKPGMILNMRDSNSGEALEATVSDVGPDGILLDLNHPLAGEALHFQVKIAALRPATHEELEHGHVHNAGHDH